MTKITIIDTGFNTSDRQGDKKSGTNINSLGDYLVNSGSAITLNCVKISLKGGVNLSDEPNPASNDATETSSNTFDNELYEAPFFIDARSASERNLIKELRALYRTQSVKLLYSSDTVTELKMTPELIGRTDTKFHGDGKEVDDGIPVIVCKVIGIQINNKASSNKYSFSGKITFKEEKVVSSS